MDPWNALRWQINPWNAIRSKRMRLIASATFLAAVWLIGKPMYEQQELASDLSLAEMGNADAMVMLGRRYETGEVVDKDYAQAMAWYMKAAERGSGWAMLNISELYANGLGVAKDDVAAYAWALQSARHYGDQAESRYARLAQALSPEQMRLAEQMADQWHPANP